MAVETVLGLVLTISIVVTIYTVRQRLRLDEAEEAYELEEASPPRVVTLVIHKDHIDALQGISLEQLRNVLMSSIPELARNGADINEGEQNNKTSVQEEDDDVNLDPEVGFLRAMDDDVRVLDVLDQDIGFDLSQVAKRALLPPKRVERILERLVQARSVRVEVIEGQARYNLTSSQQVARSS